MKREVDPTKLRNFLVIWIKVGFCLLEIPYTDPLKVDKDLLAGLLSAIQHRSSQNIMEIHFNKHSILFDLDEELLNVLILKHVSDNTPYRDGLTIASKAIRERFNKRTEWVKQIKMGVMKPISECALDVLSSFPLKQIDVRMTPLKVQARKQIPFQTGEFAEKLKLVESYIDNKRPVERIIEELSLEPREVIGLISVLLENNWIELLRVPKGDDILIKNRVPSERELHVLGLSNEIILFLRFFEGNLTLNEIAIDMNMTLDVTIFLVTKLLKKEIFAFPDNPE